MKSAIFTTIAASMLGLAGAASASTVGALCGNKYIGFTQDGTELTATLCETGNSTGGPNSPIGQLGWTDSAEFKPGDGYTGSGPVQLTVSGNDWSLSNTTGFTNLGVSVKQGNGYAFYVLDLNEPLLGTWFTGNGSFPTGNGLSHMNAWYKGTAAQVPIPAAGLMLIAGLGGLAALRKRRKA